MAGPITFAVVALTLSSSDLIASQTMHVLGTDDLKSAIIGKRASIPNAGVDGPLFEEFHNDGVYKRIGGRAPVFGKYYISGARLCYKVASTAEICRIFATSGGKLFYRDVGGHNGWMPFNVSPIR